MWARSHTILPCTAGVDHAAIRVRHRGHVPVTQRRRGARRDRGGLGAGTRCRGGSGTTRPGTSSADARACRCGRPRSPPGAPRRSSPGSPEGPTRATAGGDRGGPRPPCVSPLEAAIASPLVSAVSDCLAGLHVDGELLQFRLVGTGMVPAEEQLPAGGQDGANLGRCTATVASVRGGEFWPGQGSGHRHLPPFGNRLEDRSRRLRPSDRRPSTVSDPDDDRSCSRAALSWVTYRSSRFSDRCYRVGPGTTRW